MGASLLRSVAAAPLFAAAFSLAGSGVAQSSSTCFLVMDQFSTANAGLRMLRVQGMFHLQCAKPPANNFLHMNYQGVVVPGFDFPINPATGQEQSFGPVVLNVPQSAPVRGTTPLTFYALAGDAVRPDQKTSPITIEFFQP